MKKIELPVTVDLMFQITLIYHYTEYVNLKWARGFTKYVCFSIYSSLTRQSFLFVELAQSPRVR